MTLKINGSPVPCPRCSVPLPGWKREELPDRGHDRVFFVVSCGCGFYEQLETLVLEHRPVSLAGPGTARVDDPPASKAAAQQDFGGRRQQVLDVLTTRGPMDALAVAQAVSENHAEMDPGQASRRLLDLVKRGAVVVVGDRTNARGSKATVYAVTRRAEEAA